MIPEIQHETVIILDFGSQYTQLIARRVREAGVYCEILPFNTPVERILARQPKGLILSGSPSSVYQEGAPRPDAKLLQLLKCPLLGICYGLQILAFDMGGDVAVVAESRIWLCAAESCRRDAVCLFKGSAGRDGCLDEPRRPGDLGADGFHVTALTDDALNAFEDIEPRNITACSFIRKSRTRRWARK